MKDFLKETDFATHEVSEIFSLAASFKKLRNRHVPPTLDKQSWGMLFYKNSTRTRISFEVGICELGGHPVVLNQSQMQLSRGESVEDTAEILSRYLHGLIIRCYEHEVIERFAKAARIPVINALTDYLHPCQIYSDAFTIAEKLGGGSDPFAALAGKKIAFLGDCSCNMANSWVLGAKHFGMDISLAGPANFGPGQAIRDELTRANLPTDIHFTQDASEAVREADILYTDVWVSMGDEAEAAERKAAMQPYAVTMDLLAKAKPDALFMHCLPAHPGEEVDQAVLDSDQAIIFVQAENRLHVQKAILAVIAEANR